MSEGVYGVIGTGAVASAVGAFLTQQGKTAIFLARTGPTARRFNLASADGPARLYSFTKPAGLTDISCVFVAVKAYDLEAALRQHLPALPRGVPVISLCNGAVEDLIDAFANEALSYRWRLGVATVGVQVDEVGACYRIRSSSGRITWGPIKANEPASAAEQELLGSVFAWDDAARVLARRKWLYNVVINSLTAAERLPRNGLLLADLARLRAVFAEAFALGTRLWGGFGESKDELFQTLLQLVRDTADNENSMARDVRLGRRSESAFLAGLATNANAYPLLMSLHRKISGDP